MSICKGTLLVHLIYSLTELCSEILIVEFIGGPPILAHCARAPRIHVQWIGNAAHKSDIEGSIRPVTVSMLATMVLTVRYLIVTNLMAKFSRTWPNSKSAG